MNTELDHLAALYRLMKKHQDQTNADKIVDLYEKLKKKELNISFSGHFSAGKSSMINALMGEDILPKSPIPTSANIVKVNSGEGVARIYFKNGDPLEYEEPYDLDMIKEYSTDRDSIQKIEISTKKQIVPEGASIIDTPGIDAADDADRLMTESSLHIVDVLFYVMDYNHVQSEVNLQFLKSVQEKNIPFYIIINQIDKHDENELLFTDFQKSVQRTFQQWLVHPEDIFYTSLYEPDIPHNQFTEIKELLSFMMAHKDDYLNIDASVQQVMEEHKRFLRKEMEETMSAESFTDVEGNDQLDELLAIKQKLTDLEAKRKQFEMDYQDEMKHTLQNAYLMPASLRDLAKSFLESEQSDFKVGFFGSKKKTALEKQRRLDAFLSKLKENMEASIQWKLREKFTNLAHQYGISGEAVQKQIQELNVTYSAEDAKKLVKPGAKVNGDSVLHYTNDVSADIKSKYRKQALDLLEFLNKQLKDSQIDEETMYRQQLQELEQLAEVQKKKEQLEAELKEKVHLLEHQLLEPSVQEEDRNQLEYVIDERRKAIKKATSPQVVKKTTKTESKNLSRVEQDTKKEYSILQLLTDIDKSIETVEDLPGFDTLIRDLQDKKHALAHRSYTIALFGAFSAGKSSFANALIGEKVLPVSPNPTTATVNRIQPVTDEYGHRTVVVTLKDDEVLTKELKQITKDFSPQATNFHDLLEWVKRDQIFDKPELDNMYQAFLHAMVDGYDYSKDFIGKTKTITLDEFPAYVTDESKACYIESIDLYYDSPLTRQGITLVDTPGADSVNARHTNVAFDYIKHADAILYVTYYNHALSRADKDFLMQLGRVKEAFELDKMFFIVNAADLARDNAELKMVTDYVEEQLAHLGIRLPRLYPVSSKESLANKLEGVPLNEKMVKFEDRFYQFIKSDLAQLTIQSALWDIHRTDQTLDQFINSVNMDEDAKEKRKLELLQKQEELNEKIDGIASETYDNQLKQKIDKQLYYVQERLSIRFHDMFKEMFNPTTITESGRKAQEQLKSSLNKLIEYVADELLQEVKAVSLRMESFIEKQAFELHKNIASMSEKTDELFVLPSHSNIQLTTPEYKQAFDQLDRSVFHKALKMFKGTKAFFEKNEKEEMKEAIYEILEPFISEYLDENKGIMTERYIDQWQQTMSTLQTEAKEIIGNHIQNYEEMMANQVDIAVLEEKQRTITTILQRYESGVLTV